MYDAGEGSLYRIPEVKPNHKTEDMIHENLAEYFCLFLLHMDQEYIYKEGWENRHYSPITFL